VTVRESFLYSEERPMYLAELAQNEQSIGDTKLISQSRNRISSTEKQKVLD